MRKRRRSIRFRVTAALLSCAMVISSLFSNDIIGYAQDGVQTEETKKEWDEDKIYQADFTFMMPDGETFSQSGRETQPVKVKDENLMVNLEWLADGLGLVLERTGSDVSSQNLWTAVGDMKEDDMTGTETIFRLRKEAGSSHQIMLCTGAPTAITISYYLGQSSLELGAPVVEEELEDGTVCCWAPLNDILYLVNSHAIQSEEMIAIYPCELTAVDILHEKNFTERFYCNVLEDSGLEVWQIAMGSAYKGLYDQLKNLYGGVVNVDYSALFKLCPSDFQEEAGAILAQQMCSSDPEIQQIQKESANYLTSYFSADSALIQEMMKLLNESNTKAVDAAKAAEEATRKLMSAAVTERRDREAVELFQKYMSFDTELATLEKNELWWSKTGKALDGIVNYGGPLLGAYLQTSVLISELNRVDKAYANNVQTFLRYDQNGESAIADPVKEGLSERIAMYVTEGKDRLYTAEAVEEAAKILTKTGSDLYANLSASVFVTGMAPYQWIHTGWEIGEFMVNQYTSGAFDALDALNLSLYGMQLESASLNALVDYRAGMRADVDMTELRYDESKLETFSALAWVYLKSCYVTRKNMLDFYQTQEKNEQYELAFADEEKLQKELCRYMEALLKSSPGGDVADSASEKFGKSDRNPLDAVKGILENNDVGTLYEGIREKMLSAVHGKDSKKIQAGRLEKQNGFHENVNWTECQYLLKAVRDDDRQIFYDYLKSDYIPEYGLASLDELSWNLHDLGMSSESDYMKANRRCGLVSAVVRDFDLDGVTDMVAFRLEAIPHSEVWPEIFTSTKYYKPDFAISADFYTLEKAKLHSPKVTWKDTYSCLNWLDGRSWGGIWIELEQLENGIYIDSSTEAEDMTTYGATPRTIFHIEDGKFVMDYIMGIHWGQGSLDRNPNRLMGTTNIDPQDYTFRSRTIPFEEVNPDGDERENRCVYWGEFECTNRNRGDITYRGTDYTGLRTILEEGTKAFPHKPLPQGGLIPENPAVAEGAEAVKPLADYIAEQSGCVYVDSDSNYYEKSKLVIVEYETEEYSSLYFRYNPETKKITYIMISNNSYPVPQIWFQMKDAALSYPGFGLDPNEITQFFGKPYNYSHFANGIKIKGATVSIIQVVDTNVRIQLD
ncbi:MAG: hypothetical protein Q4F29_01205 [Lachnospiraceae bacterium]|nr:hypothetical protein [Lachnospiraceae bacterium]